MAVVERLNVDGSLDTTFGNGGKVVTAAGGNDGAFAVALEPNGNILTAGTHDGEFALWQYQPNGSPDNHFGHNGMVLTSVGGNADAYALALEPDGTIVVGGGAGGSFAFTRYHANGTLDSTFGQGGVTVLPADGAGDVVGGLALGPDGSIVAAGASGADVVAMRLTPSGAIDPTFGSGGEITLTSLAARQDLGEPDHTEGIAIQSDGKILVANRTVGATHFGVVRLNSDGTLDSTFGAAGSVSISFGGDDDADTVLVKPDGEILVVGTTDAGGTVQTAVAALNPDGSLDGNFGTGGLLTLPTGISATGAIIPAGTVAPQALHIGDIFLRAFGDIAPSGQVLVGTSNESVANDTTGLLRLNVAGAGSLGHFGTIAGKNRSLPFVTSTGTRVTVSLTGGGSAQALYDGTKVDLILTGTTVRSVLSIKCIDGNGHVIFGDVRSDGPMRAINAPNAELSGTLSIAGSVGRILLARVSGTDGAGTIATAGSIGSLVVTSSLTSAQVLAGADFGTDGVAGGSSPDTFNSASIGKISVGGKVTASTFAAGVNPEDGVYLNGNDQLVGTPSADSIGSVYVRGGTDDITRFIAGAFGKAKLPHRVAIATDSRFDLMT